MVQLAYACRMGTKFGLDWDTMAPLVVAAWALVLRERDLRLTELAP